MNTLNKRHAGAAALLGAAFIFSTFGILVRIIDTMFGDYTQVLARVAVALVIIFIINKLRTGVPALLRSQKIHALLLGLCVGITLIFFTISIGETKIANTVFMLYAGMLLMSFAVGTIFLKETVTWQKLAAIALTVVGVALFVDPTIGLTLGITMGFAAGVMEGIASYFRKITSGADRKLVLEYVFLGATLTAAVASLGLESEPIKEMSLLAIAMTILFGFLLVKLNDLLLFGFQNFDVNIGSVILALELLLAGLLGYVFFSEALTTSEILGGCIIAIASVLSVWEFKKQQTSEG